MNVKAENAKQRLNQFCTIDKKGNRKLSVVKILLNTKEFLALIIEIIELIQSKD